MTFCSNQPDFRILRSLLQLCNLNATSSCVVIKRLFGESPIRAKYLHRQIKLNSFKKALEPSSNFLLFLLDIGPLDQREVLANFVLAH